MEHKKRYEKSEIYKMAFLLTLASLSTTTLLSDTPPLCKISDVGANLCAHLNTA
ncbi:hypothetical protein [uncultured Campylobacter sp.]|uniref:hypothetical protein n=1 Tax=uncultured Campylobacter sp. TaxID=218934 RepID=UPI0026325840|nr:hypothetical protein [uncultured Campylobacter sp.]